MKVERQQKAVDRILRILHLIAYEPREWSIPRLSKVFQVSERTLSRDIQKLRSAGIDIYNEPTGGFYVTSPIRQLPIALSRADFLWTRFAIDVLQKLGGERAGPAVSLLEAMLTQSTARRSQATPSWTDRVLWQSAMGAIVQTSAQAHITTFLQALHENRTLRITYTTSRGLSLETDFDPYWVIMRPNGPYAIGYSHTREAIRTLKLSRMVSVNLLQTTFVINPTRDNAWDPKTAMGIDNDGSLETVRLLFSPQVSTFVAEELGQTQLHWQDRMDSGHYEVTLEVRVNIELIRWILQYGADVQVLDPPTLRSRIRNIAQGIVERYGEES